jgi:hypothetical protein
MNISTLYPRDVLSKTNKNIKETHINIRPLKLKTFKNSPTRKKVKLFYIGEVQPGLLPGKLTVLAELP